MIDNVLEPYQPGWFVRWGWIVLTVAICLATLACIGLLGHKLYQSRKEHQYQALENEED